MMDVTQDLIYITLPKIHSKLLMVFFFKLMMPIESSIPLKNDVSCNVVLKYYITISLR